MSALFNTVKQAVSEFLEDDCMSSAAAIAYGSIFALPPLLVIVFMLASYAGVPQEQINQAVKEQLGLPSQALRDPSNQQHKGRQGLAGKEQGGSDSAQHGSNGSRNSDSGDAAASDQQDADQMQLQQIAERAQSKQLGSGVGVGKALGVVVLIFTATGLFAQLQLSLNRAWEVEPDPEQGGVKRFLIKRFLSLGMILVIAFLLLISMVVSAMITQIMSAVQGAAPDTAARIVGFALDNLVTLGLGTLLFAAMFKILPDADMAWRDTFAGAVLTALLFVIGKALVAWYLQSSDLGASWGDTAGPLIAVLAWLYYSSLIVLFGAEVTQVWAKRYGGGIRASQGAVRTVREIRHERH